MPRGQVVGAQVPHVELINARDEGRGCFNKGLDRRSKSGIVFFLMVC